MKKRLKIAIFESLRLLPGGGQKVIPNVCKYLSQKHDITVFIPKLPENKSDFGKVKFNLIKPRSRYLTYTGFLAHKLKKSENFDLIIFGCYPTTFSIFRNSRYPSIHLTHSPPRFFYDLKKFHLKNSGILGKIKVHIKNILFKRIDYNAVQKVDRILGISKEVQKRIKKYYKRDSNVFYAGIDPEKYREGKYEDYILSVTRMVKTKRPEVIVKAMGLVKNKKIKMIMVGTGDMDREIREMARKYPNVEFKGFVSDEELSKLYSNCLAAVYVPINEDMGFVPMEAGACGKATIGVNEGGLKDLIVDGKTGFLIDKITPQKLADKIDCLANNKNIARKMGKAAKKFTTQFHLENTFAVLDKAIEEVMMVKKEN